MRRKLNNTVSGSSGKKKILKICKNGHRFYKSSDCPVCPFCEKESKPKDGFLASIRLGAPARRALENNGIKSLKKLASFSEKEILKLHGLGKSSLPLLKNELKKAGLNFRNKT